MELNNGIAQLKALINTSLYYSSDSYDIERFIEMKKILSELAKKYAKDVTDEDISLYFDSDIGYVTPKVDVRAVVFNSKNQLLLVKEKRERTWSLPGGWADVGYSPSEIACKETFEEAGLTVKPVSLYKVVDKSRHSYPKSLEYVYKLFFYCSASSYETQIGLETSDVSFFSLDEIKSLENISAHRNTLGDLLEAFAFHENPQAGAKFD